MRCAPTGRASKRLSEATGMTAKTIHRLLHVDQLSGGFAFNEYQPLKCDVLIVDEASMIDVPLMKALLCAIPLEATVIFVGDKDQLPSVGPGQVLEDMIKSNALPCIHLTEVFRQAESSRIIQVAQQINQGKMPDLKNLSKESDFFFLEMGTSENILSTLIDLVKVRLPQKLGYCPFKDIQVLCPMNKGIVGTHNLNRELQRTLNPPTAESLQKQAFTYSVGDKVIQIENNYDKDVYNGDIGTILKIDQEEEKIVIHFDDREIDYALQELEEIHLAYAMTIHKSQGSEYPVIIIPLTTAHYPMLRKNLIYTGITRGKKLVIVVGQQQALQIALNNHNLGRRWSMLETHLREETAKSMAYEE
jgi:exodeoxyribonuclease V alpha subunit